MDRPHNHRSAGSARRKSPCCASSREKPAQWWRAGAFITRKPAVCWRPRADKSQHRIAPNGRPLAGVVAYFGAWTDHNHRGAASVRRKLACCATIQEITNAVARPRDCHAKAGCAGGRSWHIAPRPCSEWKRPPAGALPFSIAWTDHTLCGSARASRKRVCCASFQEIVSAMARPCVCHAKAGCVLETVADKSQHGLALNRRPLAGAVAFRNARTDHNHRCAGRACRKRACCASPRETASAVVARPRVYHAKAGCVLEARSRQVAARSCTE